MKFWRQRRLPARAGAKEQGLAVGHELEHLAEVCVEVSGDEGDRVVDHLAVAFAAQRPLPEIGEYGLHARESSRVA